MDKYHLKKGQQTMASIGIFWIHKSKLYSKSIALDRMKPINGFIDSDFAHYKVWDEIVSQNKDLYLYEYEEIPRRGGRIVFDMKQKLFIIYTNYDIINLDEAKRLIMDTFGLDNKAVSFQYDVHYKI